MKTISNIALSLACAWFGVMMASAHAAPLDFMLPAETAKLRPSTLPGMTQAQWTAEMAKMRHAYGAPISDEEVKQIGAYLAVAYGSAKATDAAVLALNTPAVASTEKLAPVAAATAGPTVDVQALLTNNACLGCHALAQKVVGPSYKEVASKYKGESQALAKLQTSIKKGGVGKWGQIPMPPFAALSDAQAKALAEFVLKQ